MPDGLITRPSSLGPRETMDRVAAAVSRRGMSVAARIDHAAAARSAGLSLRPTEVLVFGNPAAGTPLMQAAATLAIDLPLKMLVFEDEEGITQIAWNDPAWIAHRHGLDPAGHPQVKAMSDALAAVAQEAAAPTEAG